ncbi:MAG: hypothetical protein PHV77_00465 [Candidatus Omnitrophica bacterium]|nr:hypothetical protein [Candidatus Omnitrophota bacterium]
MGGGFSFHCFLLAIRELTDGLRAVRASKTENIKIAPAIGGALPPKRISFSFFALFNFLFSETEKKLQGQKNQKGYKNMSKKIYIHTFG